MSFDQDPNEQANISGADFALMCDEMRQLRASNSELLIALRALVERGTDSPEHIAAERAITKATKGATNE